MKKRNIIIVCIVVFVLIIIVSVIYLIFKDKSGSEVYDLNKDIERVYLISGSTGNSVLLEQSQKDELLEQWNNVRLKRKLINEQYSGWLYRIQIYQDGSCINITFSGNRCDVNGTEYSIKNNIDELIHICDSYF